MNKVLFWIRDNLVIFISIVVMVIAIAALFLAIGGQSAAFQEELEDAKRVQSQIRAHLNRKIDIPSADPSTPKQSVSHTVNPNDVEALRQIFERMNSGYESLAEQAEAFNRTGPGGQNPHEPLVEGLFPTPRATSILFNARDIAYFDAFERMYKTLDAGIPPTEAQIAARMAQVERKTDTNMLPGADGDPELARRKAEARIDLLIQRAQRIDIYARPLVGRGARVSPGVFQIGEWASREDQPDIADLWEGQMQTWIQQDMVMAIRLANRPTPGAEDSVLTLPVKRLLKLSVEPGYVGRGGGESRGRDAAAPPAPAQPIEVQLDQPLTPNFTAWRTGRVTNPLYDVRLARMSVIVDAQRIPELLNAITQVNLMTPLVERITMIDQEAHFLDGYVYGDGVDVVQMDLLIETIWLRSWTAGSYDRASAERLGEPFEPGLMPDKVRAKLDLPPRDPNFDADAATGGEFGSSDNMRRFEDERGPR